MISREIQTLIEPTTLGRPRRRFIGDELNELAKFMAPDANGRRKTQKEAAEHFKCSKSLIEKTIYQLRRSAKQSAPTT